MLSQCIPGVLADSTSGSTVGCKVLPGIPLNQNIIMKIRREAQLSHSITAQPQANFSTFIPPPPHCKMRRMMVTDLRGCLRFKQLLRSNVLGNALEEQKYWVTTSHYFQRQRVGQAQPLQNNVEIRRIKIFTYEVQLSKLVCLVPKYILDVKKITMDVRLVWI